jgi:hypothetical protein
MAGGRPTKLTPEIIEQAKNYYSLGATDKEVVQFLNICESTLYNWKNSSPEFLECIKTAQEVCIDRVSRTLYTKACGYSVKESKVFREQGETVIVDVDKHFQPDTTSMIFYLKNKDPDNWKDVKERVDIHRLEESEINYNELARRLAHVFNNALDESHTQH